MKKLPEITNTNAAVRLTLDYEEDYWLLMSIFRILGGNPDREKVMQLFADNPDLAKINLFRNDEWKAAQLSKKV
jgi:spore coat polysaccharide biosynthesis protein SpsF (cytidylyltransferase family)